MKKSSEENKQEAHEERGEASAYNTLGILGAVGWGGMELALMSDVLQGAVELGEQAVESKNTKRKIGFALGAVAIGALCYAAFKYKRAHDLEKRATQEAESWQDRISQKTEVAPTITM